MPTETDEIAFMLVPRHSDDECHNSQKELLRSQENPEERARLAQVLRWGNAAHWYYHHQPVEATEADYLEWLEGLPARPQAAMRALGFEAHKNALPLRRYVLEKNDVGMSAFMQKVLSATDWQDYQAAESTALAPWLPPLS